MVSYFWIIAVIIAALIITVSLWMCMRVGTFKIDRSNPEKDVYRLDIDDIDKLDKRKYVVLKVDRNADLSQK